MIRKFNFLALALLTLTQASIRASDFQYIVENGQAIITGYTGSGGEVTIPSTLNGLQVIAIGTNALPNTPFTDVVISEGIARIAIGAFVQCSLLKTVSLPTTLTNIGDYAFASCPVLGQITIPPAVSSIGYLAFADCTAMQSYTVQEPNPFYSSVAGVLFDESLATLIQFPAARTGGYAVPEGVRSIGPLAFERSQIGSVTISSTVTNIENDALRICLNLTAITIPTNVVSLGTGVFYGDNKLAQVIINAPLQEIKTAVFGDCRALQQIVLPNTITNLADEVFLNCYKLQSAELGGFIRSIGPSAFFMCTNLTSVHLGHKLVTIRSSAFERCSALSAITMPATLQFVDSAAFDFCDSLKSIYFEGNPPSVGQLPFSGATLYYLPTATGWPATLAGRPCVLWNPSVPISQSTVGVRNGQFGFTITGTSGISLTVQSTADFLNWTDLQTLTLTNGSALFSGSGSDPMRFYRFRSPP